MEKTAPKTRDVWSALTLYEKFEQAVVITMSAMIAVVVVVAMWNLIREVAIGLVAGVFDPLEHATFQTVFGMIFTVVIALEFKRSLLVVTERRFGIIQARSVVLIALIAVVRKFIIVDLGEVEPAKVAVLAAAVLALGCVYWLVRDQDEKERRR